MQKGWVAIFKGKITVQGQILKNELFFSISPEFPNRLQPNLAYQTSDLSSV